MVITKPNPTFEVKQLKDGSGYYVLVRWPNGMERQVPFADQESAQFWIEHDADAWVSALAEASDDAALGGRESE